MTQNIIIGAFILIGLYVLSTIIYRSFTKRNENDFVDDQEEEWIRIHQEE